jgi:HK97 family phage portal protein
MREYWDKKHAGPANRGRMGILYNGAEIKTLGIPLKDAQFIETQQFSSDLVAKIFLGPAAMLLGDQSATVMSEELSLRFLNFCLLPRLKRIERAFRSDLDLFAGTELYPEFRITEFLRANAATRDQVQHNQVQDGRRLVDELRAEDGLGPLPPIPDNWQDEPGKVPQITPVGGAVNPTADTTPKE